MRETGVVRKALSGEEAAPYIGFARTLLGGMKARMQLGGLAQDTMTRSLPDGTTIRVRSIFGQDQIEILAPVPTTAPREEVEIAIPVPESVTLSQPKLDDELVFTGLVVCGNINYGGFRAFRWMQGPGATILPLAAGTTQSKAFAISQDGTTVVGSCFDDAGNIFAVRWKANNAVEVLGAGSGLMEATGVNKDGTVICGHGVLDGIRSRMWVWKAKTGIVQLPNSFQIGTEPGPAISRSGKIIAGSSEYAFTRMEWDAPSFPSYALPWIHPKHAGLDGVTELIEYSGEAATWTAGAGPNVLPDPGLQFTTHSKDEFDITINFWPDQVYTYRSPFDNVPAGVSDSGVVVGTRDGDTGFIWSPASGYDWLSPPRLTTRDATHDTSQAACITANGKAVGGSDFVGEEVLPYGWVRNATGKHMLGLGMVFAIGENGAIAGGGGGPNAANYDFVPVLWRLNGTTTILNMPDGALDGTVTGIATPVTTISTAQQ